MQLVAQKIFLRFQYLPILLAALNLSGCSLIEKNTPNICNYFAILTEDNKIKEDLFIFAVKINKKSKYGYLSKTGKIIIEPIFYDGSSFTDGHAIVKTRPEKNIQDDYGGYALINKTGKIVVYGAEDELFLDFQKGVLTKHSLSIFEKITHHRLTSSRIITEKYQKSQDSLSSSFYVDNKKYGFIDQHGVFKIQPIFTDITEFSGGLASVTTDISKNKNYRLINTKGNLGIDLEDKHSIDNNLRTNTLPELVRVKSGGMYGYVNRCGDVVIPPIYYYASSFNENIAIVGNRKQYEIIDRTGKSLIKLNSKFDPLDTSLGMYYPHRNLFHFSSGLARIKIDGKYGYINKQGEISINANFIKASDFVNGVASVHTRDNKWSYIDLKGKIIWQESVN